MRLAFVSLHTSPIAPPGAADAGGMNVVAWAQAEALGAIGHSVDLITRRTDPSEPDEVALSDTVTLRHLTAGPTTPLPKSVIDQHIEAFSRGLAGLGPYDLIHSHHWMSGEAALPLARRWRVPHVQSFHSVAAPPGAPLSEGEPAESPDRIAGEAHAARESDAIIVNSAAEARLVIERCGANPDAVHIVSPGVDHELFHPDAAARAAQGDGYLLFAARLQPFKGPDLAIDALAQLPADMRPRLVVAGAASADFAGYSEELRALAERLGVADLVTFVGPQSRPDLARLMREARLVLVPSYSETFGLVALEAAASGTPVIAAAAGGLREVVVHGETGQLMDSRQPCDWSKAIARLLTKPALAEEMGVIGRVHSRRFDWDYSARHLSLIYETLVKNG